MGFFYMEDLDELSCMDIGSLSRFIEFSCPLPNERHMDAYYMEDLDK